MAKKQTLGNPAPPEPLTEYKMAKLCGAWSRLNEERLELQRQAAAKADEQSAIERELVAELHRQRKTAVLLPRFEFGLQLCRGSLYYKVELIRAIGQEEFDRRQDAVPQQNKFFLRDRGTGPKAPRSAPKKRPPKAA